MYTYSYVEYAYCAYKSRDNFRCVAGPFQATPNGLEICGSPCGGAPQPAKASIAPKPNNRLAASVEDPRPFQGASRSEAEGVHRDVGQYQAMGWG